MLDKIRKVLGRTYYPLNRIELSKNKLLYNYAYLKSLEKKIKIAPVVKSNAYGHGIQEVAKILDNEKPPFFCVDSLYEAYQLKKANIKSPVLIMGFVDGRNLKVRKLAFSFAVFDLEFARALNKYQPGANIHIKVDTGMNRMGVSPSNLTEFLNQIKKLKSLNVEGVMSHFSSPRTSKVYSHHQLANFRQSRMIFDNLNIMPKWSHIAASGGLFNIKPGLLTRVSNLARCGIALYGASSEGETKPVLELKSKIVHIKKLKRGDMVGYDRTFQAAGTTTIGILPIGYNDGVDRRLSNKGFVTYKKIKCPIIGRVSMNITTIDITRAKKAKVGDAVTVISSNPQDPNSAKKLSLMIDTIPHDILVHLESKSIKRVII